MILSNSFSLPRSSRPLLRVPGSLLSALQVMPSPRHHLLRLDLQSSNIKSYIALARGVLASKQVTVNLSDVLVAHVHPLVPCFLFGRYAEVQPDWERDSRAAASCD